MAFEDQGLQDVVLHLPAALRDRAEEMASRESLSLNLFVLMAVAEKLQRLQLQHLFEISEKEELHGAISSTGDSLVH
jgi:hypothetical protein